MSSKHKKRSLSSMTQASGYSSEGGFNLSLIKKMVKQDQKINTKNKEVKA